MKNVLKRATLFNVCLFIIPVLLLANERIQVKLPVRIVNSTEKIDNLESDGFSLYINGKQRELIECKKKVRSIDQISDLGRNFILSFHLPYYSNQIKNAITYFITELLISEDSLILLTPIQIYQIKISKNKERIISGIESILMRDCTDYKNARIEFEKKLSKEAEQLNKSITSNEMNNSPAFSFSSIMRFLNIFSTDLFQYRKNYLLPDLNKYAKIFSLLQERDGDRWWLHFQHGDVVPLLPRIKSINREIRSYIDTATSLGYSKTSRIIGHLLSNFEKNLILADSFPKQSLKDSFIGNNITYNVILLKDSQKRSTRLLSIPAEFKAIFEEISFASGGKTVATANPEDAIGDIKSHRDFYYEIIYHYNGRVEDKKLQVKSNKLKSKLVYRSFYSKEEIHSLIRYNSREKVEISNLNLEGRKIKFTIKSFKRQGKDKTGILKIRVNLVDRNKDTVYEKTNTLRASKEKVSISFSVPSTFKGHYTVVITACDKMANRVAYEQTLVSL